ncbi:hypothetical protein IQ269_02480 [Tychonema sp. LEGE 07199]|uniref:hypothetical protein n=1 Tax=Microcoleaceae TaxID=1892252 RepID=UPI0011B1CEDF|nr:MULTISPECIES: hypothetical protein [unclassified Tychonema]MBE9119698.1 hypothetical protein [Tychonema sp. LEGE 07199]MBE9130761.1 hypothetical protein [Tychonema sp. LEGE 07196]
MSDNLRLIFSQRAIVLSQKLPLSLAASPIIFRSTQSDTLAMSSTTMPQQSPPAIFVKLVEPG